MLQVRFPLNSKGGRKEKSQFTLFPMNKEFMGKFPHLQKSLEH